MKYDWNYLFELGYEASELEAFERQGWAEGVYETLSDPDLIDSYQDNARYMLRFFSKSATLRLMVGYSSAFMISHETFVSRIEQVAELFGKNWQETVIECEGVTAKHTTETAFPDGAETLEAAQEIIYDYLSREGVKLSHSEGDRAFYRPATDEVVLPIRKPPQTPRNP